MWGNPELGKDIIYVKDLNELKIKEKCKGMR